MINFPNSPAPGAVFNHGALTWVHDGEKWALASGAMKYIIGCYVPGKPAAGQVLLNHPFSKAVTIPAGFGAHLGHTSRARGGAAAAAATTISIQRATAAAPTSFVEIGTISFAAGAVVGSFSGGPIDLGAGDTLALIAPATPDTSFAGFAATVVGRET